MSQATADLPETASDEPTGEQLLADVLDGFAEDGHGSEPTTSPDSESDTSANPDLDTADATEQTEPPQQEEAADRLAAALQRLDALEANHKKYS